jgi:hypothetical protein
VGKLCPRGGGEFRLGEFEAVPLSAVAGGGVLACVVAPGGELVFELCTGETKIVQGWPKLRDLAQHFD